MESVIERNKRLGIENNIAQFLVKQQLPYKQKVQHAKNRAWEFYNHPEIENCHVSVGGLDSITLLCFLRSIGISVPAVSVSSLEDRSIQAVHKELGIIPLKPLKTKVEVEANEDNEVVVRIISACQAIKTMAAEVGEEFDAFDICMQKPGNGPFYEFARSGKAPIHAACPVISGIIKCVEAECRLALKKNATIEFID